MRPTHLALLCALLGCWLGAARAGEVQVAVASNVAAPLARIAEGFSAASGHTPKVSSGAAGKFHTQIQSGAPFEVLIAASGMRQNRQRHVLPAARNTHRSVEPSA
jgi:molybdate transport system substrate-binding protein